ncbi:GntR family transcriptional regulator [Sporolactobacillus nakayamae]|uniref:GntR family transcriptional regulator, frlABCD operon transcriptional regulator n=1 Tax=Sporolactobacillus nakayamae TaxID=269670 RepID=A0A1I2UWV2_9BACL|nr:GntR family transcriptional regulator [Sporolactobacillus nakayamae]SFG79251.1 GntR family transcriptional regulator, frlABCD operon transcriptional regulator [Sporolactobacillus nakayamae]
MVLPDIPKPLYEQLENEIRNHIISGDYSYGKKIPSEKTLMEKFGISRVTVRKAIDNLCKDGLLEKKQGKGTFVKSVKIKDRLDSIHGFTDSLNKNGRWPRKIIIEKSYKSPDERIRRELKIDADELIIYLKRVLLDGGSPYMIDESFYSAKKFPGLFDKINNKSSTYKLLEQDYQTCLAKSYKEISIVVADKLVQEELNCSIDEPLFYIHKIVYDVDDNPVQVSNMKVLGTRVTYSIESIEGSSYMNHTVDPQS